MSSQECWIRPCKVWFSCTHGKFSAINSLVVTQCFQTNPDLSFYEYLIRHKELHWYNCGVLKCYPIRWTHGFYWITAANTEWTYCWRLFFQHYHLLLFQCFHPCTSHSCTSATRHLTLHRRPLWMAMSVPGGGGGAEPPDGAEEPPDGAKPTPRFFSITTTTCYYLNNNMLLSQQSPRGTYCVTRF